MIIHLEEGGLFLDIAVEDGRPARLLHFSDRPMNELPTGEAGDHGYLVEVHLAGENLDAHHAQKHSGSGLGPRLSYQSHHIEHNRFGRQLQIEQVWQGIHVVSKLQFFTGLPCVRCRTLLSNHSDQTIVLEYVTSFCQYQLPMGEWENNTEILIPHNSWTIECNWKRYDIRDLGLFSGGSFTLKRIGCQNTGSWSTVEYLPMGMVKNTAEGRMQFWQIEHNGSWVWEMGDQDRQLYLQLMGPTSEQSGFYKQIVPGETFESVPAAVGVVTGDVEEAIDFLTRYRRIIRRRDDDNTWLPVIYNDFIALGSSPTADKEYPLIDAAAQLGCEIYCIDAGWYDTGDWWDRVGEWEECRERFPEGLRAVTERIEERGMIPGIWLEPEVMGIACPSAASLPDDWFFFRYGKRVIDHGRYLLDFRNKEVREYITAVLERLIQDYHIGYFKLDYNVTTGIGTDRNADSLGAGLLEHNRAVIAWAEELFQRHPELIVETCASGGCRMDYAMLSVYSMQSVSDQSDYRKVARISALCASAITPEQAGIWAAPKETDDPEQTAFHMINTLLCRIHQSGHIENLSARCYGLLQEGIQLYKKKIRTDLPYSCPIWPLGWPDDRSESYVYGWTNPHSGRGYLAVWRLTGSGTVEIPLTSYAIDRVEPVYPLSLKTDAVFKDGTLRVCFDQNYSARLFELHQAE